MIDTETFKRMTYGLYIVSSGNQEKGNGYISNSVFQITAKPAQIAACCHKDNYTAEIIKETGSYSVAILHNEAETSIIDKFGYVSGADTNKLIGMNVEYGATGVPIILNDVIAWIECKVVNIVDVGTHLMFIGEVLQTELVDETKAPMTYSEFKKTKQRVAPANAPTYIDEQEDDLPSENTSKYKCSRCGYVHNNDNEDIPFEELPADWKCPVCNAPKSEFFAI
jgi:flavin reductase (DIM6/NTAB) family NADH-FMN oxidoreductase RutF/rubredoxin